MGIFSKNLKVQPEQQVTKNPLASKTIWGLITTLASMIGLMLNIDFTPLLQQAMSAHSVVAWLSVAGTAIGLIMAYFGRKHAKGGLN